jgi:hypothetical protein
MAVWGFLHAVTDGSTGSASWCMCEDADEEGHCNRPEAAGGGKGGSQFRLGYHIRWAVGLAADGLAADGLREAADT